VCTTRNRLFSAYFFSVLNQIVFKLPCLSSVVMCVTAHFEALTAPVHFEKLSHQIVWMRLGCPREMTEMSLVRSYDYEVCFEDIQSQM
jgi:hypothetical protein